MCLQQQLEVIMLFQIPIESYLILRYCLLIQDSTPQIHCFPIQHSHYIASLLKQIIEIFKLHSYSILSTFNLYAHCFRSNTKAYCKHHKCKFLSIPYVKIFKLRQYHCNGRIIQSRNF